MTGRSLAGGGSAGMLEVFSAFVADALGLHFPPARWADLARHLGIAARELGFEDVDACMAHFLAAPLTQPQTELLAGYLTVGESYFFRESDAFKAFEMEMLPELLSSRRGKEQRLRIWSAGCATGEEPYTLAILLRRMIPDLADWNVTILATDISARALHKASAGIYTQWSFRQTPSWVRDMYFKPAGDGRFLLDATVREMVTFAHLNLVRDSFPSLANATNAMDIIFCRNVLMYFTPAQAEAVTRGFCQALVEGGWFFTGAAESALSVTPALSRARNSGTNIFRKESVLPTAKERKPAPWSPTFRATAIPPIPEKKVVAPKPEPLRPQASVAAAKLFELGDYEGAVLLLEQEVASGAVGPKVSSLLARGYANLGELEAASTWCERTIAADKLNPRFHFLHAAILQEQDLPDAAVAALRRTLYLDQGFLLAHVALANLLVRLGKPSSAKRHEQQAIELAGKLPADELLPDADGMTAGRLLEVIQVQSVVSTKEGGYGADA